MDFIFLLSNFIQFVLISLTCAEMAGASRERPYYDEFIELGFFYVTDRESRNLSALFVTKYFQMNPGSITSYNDICPQNIQRTKIEIAPFRQEVNHP